MASPPITAVRRAKVRDRSTANDEKVQESEVELRRLVARELHDRVAQTLTGMLVDLENFKTEPVSWEDVQRQLGTVQDSTRQVLRSLRELLHDLRGEETFNDTFVESVGALLVRFEQKTAIDAKLTVLPGWPQSITAPASMNLYRIVEEALTNVRRHSGARTVRIVLEPYADDQVVMIVGDDGRGVQSDSSSPAGMGTVGMKERAVILGGELRIESTHGDGTIVRAIFPRSGLMPQPRPDQRPTLDS